VCSCSSPKYFTFAHMTKKMSSNFQRRKIRVVDVQLGHRSYSIKVGAGLLSRLGKECAGLGFEKSCAIISDSNVAPLYAAQAMESLNLAGFNPVLVTVPAGEKSKCWEMVQACHEQIAKHRLERKSFIIALGGGVVGDLAGFVAATYLRGVDFVQVATTLLAQVDSSVGGKVGVNLRAGKNLVGAFHQPRLVLSDLETLATLPMREFRAGMAEVIKYGIVFDAELFNQLEQSMAKLLDQDTRTMAAVIERCCEIKAAVVWQDETESGIRAILNFGHTIGHGLEAISSYGNYLHGEAIAIGQVAAARLSEKLLGLPEEEMNRIEALFQRAGLPTQVQLNEGQQQDLIAAMQNDKKVSAGAVKFVLTASIGKASFGCQVPNELVVSTLSRLRGTA
jgi:3-dehydroquinate synthase